MPGLPIGNLGTTAAQINSELRSLVANEEIWRKIIDAIRFHVQNRLWFSERDFAFTLTAGRSNYIPGDGYGLPADLVNIVGPTLYLRLDGSTTNTQRVEWATREDFDLYKSYNDTSSSPEFWNYDGLRLQLYPVPSTSTDTLTGRYVVDIGVPKVRWNSGSSAYEFFTPDGSVTLTGDYTSDWFATEVAESLIRFRALYEILRSLKDPVADDYLARWLEAKAMLEDESDSKTADSISLTPRLF